MRCSSWFSPFFLVFRCISPRFVMVPRIPCLRVSFLQLPPTALTGCLLVVSGFVVAVFGFGGGDSRLA